MRIMKICKVMRSNNLINLWRNEKYGSLAILLLAHTKYISTQVMLTKTHVCAHI